jgi:hypothetical protein
MERKLYLRLYQAVWAVRHPCPPAGVTHSDRWVVLVFLWAALHDRPTTWATLPGHWPDGPGPMQLPSQPAMSRRLRSASVNALLNALIGHFRGDPSADWVKHVDGKPLPVGGASKDPDAKSGYGAGGYFKGYKLHAVFGRGVVPLAWEVLPANRSEPTTARLLVNRLGGGGYLVGDKGYDSAALAEQAARRNHQMVAPAKRSKGAGMGHRRQSSHRLRGLQLLRGAFGRALYSSRTAVERRFGHLAAVGLGALPAWVRRLHRVKRWVQAKLLIAAARYSDLSALAA